MAVKTAGGLLLYLNPTNLQDIYGHFINVSDFGRIAHICIKVFILLFCSQNMLRVFENLHLP